MLSIWFPVAVVCAAALSAGVLWLAMRVSTDRPPSGPTQCEAVLKKAPAIIFSTDPHGALHWTNEQFDGLDEDDKQRFLRSVQDRGNEGPLRLCCQDRDGTQDRHYELAIVEDDGSLVIFAEDVTRLVQADSVRNAFVQTLTKTFADLSTGLAVFDRSHRLVLFNPAVLDLTDLSAEFLTSRPHMIEFFDALRDRQVMPEPKNYATWRSQITDIIKSAEDGHYSERWSLPHGVTYKLTGRPHPNGAIAFLIEDISDEISLTQRSRSQLETHQSILDSMPDAIAVIGFDGNLVICNTAFSNCIGFDPEARLGGTLLGDMIPAFRRKFGNNEVWQQLEKLDQQGGQVSPFHCRASDRHGTCLSVRVEPLPDGLFVLTLSSQSMQEALPA